MIDNQKIKNGDAAGITLRTGKIVGCLESIEGEGLQLTVERSPPRREEERGEREIEKQMTPTTEEGNLQSAEENNITEQKGEKEKPERQRKNTEESSPFQKSVSFDKSVDNSYENIKNTSSYLSNSSLSDSSFIRNSTPNEEEQVGQKRKNKDPVTGFSTKRMKAIETLANLIVTPLGQIVKDFLSRTFGQENSAYIDNTTLAHNIGGALMNGCAGYLEYQVESTQCTFTK
jgi:hypothetical protein